MNDTVMPVTGARVVVVPATPTAKGGAIITLPLEGDKAYDVLALGDDHANTVEVGPDFFRVRGPGGVAANCERVADTLCRDLLSLAGRTIHVIAAGDGLTAFFGAEVQHANC